MGKLQSAVEAPVVIHFDTWLDFLLLLLANYPPKSEALAKRQEEAGGDPARPASCFTNKPKEEKITQKALRGTRDLPGEEE